MIIKKILLIEAIVLLLQNLYGSHSRVIIHNNVTINLSLQLIKF